MGEQRALRALLTAEEVAVLEHLVAAWNAFLLLPPRHPDDVTEFRHGLHALQALVMARPVAELAAGAHEPVVAVG